MDLSSLKRSVWYPPIESNSLLQGKLGLDRYTANRTVKEMQGYPAQQS